MRYALYVDPVKRDIAEVRLPADPPAVAYYRLTDMSNEALLAYDAAQFPEADFTIVEIHPAQWDFLRVPFSRLSIVADKSKFDNLTAIKSRLEQTIVDMTFNWDHRFHLNYYIKMLQYWIYCGVQQFSFYELTNFQTWLRLKEFMEQNGYYFYDRYHACLKNFQSPYQKHLAGFGDLIAVGGWSRVTDDGITRTRAPGSEDWVRLSPEEQYKEKMLFALADRDGIVARGMTPKSLEAVCAAGLAEIVHERLIPTDKGLWDTIALASQLQQNPGKAVAI